MSSAPFPTRLKLSAGEISRTFDAFDAFEAVGAWRRELKCDAGGDDVAEVSLTGRRLSGK